MYSELEIFEVFPALKPSFKTLYIIYRISILYQRDYLKHILLKKTCYSPGSKSFSENKIMKIIFQHKNLCPPTAVTTSLETKNIS